MQPERHSCGLIKIADPVSAQKRCGLRYVGSADSCWPLAMRVMLLFLKGHRLRQADVKPSIKSQLPPQPVASAPAVV